MYPMNQTVDKVKSFEDKVVAVNRNLNCSAQQQHCSSLVGAELNANEI